MDTEPDFIEEIIAESTAENADYPTLLRGAEQSRALMRALARARKRAKLTQAEMAHKMETTQSAIARLERAERDPHLSTVTRYAAFVGKALVLVDSD